MNVDYMNFVRSKIQLAKFDGFEIDDADISPILKPHQLDIVRRLIERYSNKGELVYDPFCGLGTVPYCALEMGRRGQGSELNPGYFMDSTYYLKSMEQKVSSPKLFDFEF